jgi:exopolysaccharide production protein ExoZ
VDKSLIVPSYRENGMSEPKPPSNHNVNVKLLSVQMLRGIAASLVIYAHAIDSQINLNIGQSIQQGFYFLDNFGAVGVDIFFVISGFIISLSARRFLRPNGVRDFLLKRLLRIVPNYWIVTLITLLSLLLTANSEYITTRQMLKSVLILPIFDTGWFVFPILVLGWTLAFEAYFYTVIALSLLLKRRNFIIYGIALISAFVLLGAIIKPTNHVFLRFVANPMNLEFVLGCLIGMLYTTGAKLRSSIAWGAILCGLALLSITLLIGYGEISEAERVLNGDLAGLRVILWGIPSALVVLGVIFVEVSTPLNIPPVVALIGDASYSIYLTQYLSLSMISQVWQRLALQSPDLFILVAVGFSTIVGIGVYQLLEKRLLDYLMSQYQKFMPQHRTKPRPN